MAGITNIPTFNKGPNMGGAVASFYFIPIEEVVNVPLATNGNIVDDIILMLGATWKEGEGVYQGNIFTEVQQAGGNNPDFFKVTFKGKIPQRNPITAELFGRMIHFRYLVLVTDANGFQWLLGHPDYEGLQFSADGSTGSSAASFNSHEFEFSGFMPYRAPTYQGSFIIDPGTCPPATVTGLSGTIIDLFAGSTTDLESILNAASLPDIENAIENDGRAGDVFVALADQAINSEVEEALSIAQRNAISRIKLFKEGKTPVIYQARDAGSRNGGRGTDFLTLAELNPNGNYNRFELFSANIVIDWQTNCLWTKALRPVATQSAHITTAQSLVIDGITDWYLPTRKEYMNITDSYLGNPLDYSPFNIVLSNQSLITCEIWVGGAYVFRLSFYNASRQFIIDPGLTVGQTGNALYMKQL